MDSRSLVEVSELQIDRRRLVADHAYRSDNISQHLPSTLAAEATSRQLAIASAEDLRHAAFAHYSEAAIAAEQQAPRLIAESRRAICERYAQIAELSRCLCQYAAVSQ